MKTGSDFKTAVKKHRITHWNSIRCPFCMYKKGYVFIDDKVFYDVGCDCITGEDLLKSTWDDVADDYNIQTNPTLIARMDSVFKFKNKLKAAPEKPKE